MSALRSPHAKVIQGEAMTDIAGLVKTLRVPVYFDGCGVTNADRAAAANRLEALEAEVVRLKTAFALAIKYVRDAGSDWDKIQAALSGAQGERLSQPSPNASGTLQLGAARQGPGVVVAHQHGAANGPAPLSQPSPEALDVTAPATGRSPIAQGRDELLNIRDLIFFELAGPEEPGNPDDMLATADRIANVVLFHLRAQRSRSAVSDGVNPTTSDVPSTAQEQDEGAVE